MFGFTVVVSNIGSSVLLLIVFPILSSTLHGLQSVKLEDGLQLVDF